MEQLAQLTSFWRGFGSILSLGGGSQAPVEFRFRGYDIATITAEQALRQDWARLGAAFQASARKIAEENARSASRPAGAPDAASGEPGQ